MTRASESLMQDVVEMAFENRMFYARAADLAENPVLKQQYRRMASAKDEFLDTLATLVEGRATPLPQRRSLVGTLQALYAQALDGLCAYGAASGTFAVPIAESEQRLLDHFEHALAVVDSAAVRAALAEQMPKLRACHRELQGLASVRSEARP
jgi:uncharacterized protein (TIGR02284 family)